MTEIPTDESELYLALAIDLFSRRRLGYATSGHPDAELACAAIKMAVAVRGGSVAGVIFHSKLSFPAGIVNFESSCGVCGGWGGARGRQW